MPPTGEGVTNLMSPGDSKLGVGVTLIFDVKVGFGVLLGDTRAVEGTELDKSSVFVSPIVIPMKDKR